MLLPSKRPIKCLVFTMDENRNKSHAELHGVEWRGITKEINTSLKVEISDNMYSTTLMLFI